MTDRLFAMNESERKKLFLLGSVLICIFFVFYTVGSDLYGADPFYRFGDTVVSGSDTSFLIMPTSQRLCYLTVRTQAPEGTVFSVEVATDSGNVISDAAADPEGYICFDLGIVPVVKGKEYRVSVSSSETYGLYTDETGQVWSRAGYLWITRSVLRIIGIAAGFIFTAFVYYLVFIRRLPCERLFVYISLPLCLLFAIVIPVYRVADEYMHFMRGLALARGVFIFPADARAMLPENIVPMYVGGPFDKYFSLYGLLHGGDLILSKVESSWNLETVALYNPLVYAFSTLGQMIADIFSDSLSIVLLSGRLANIIGCTWMIYLAIKYIPRGKELLMIVSIFPANLQMRASVSADAMTYAAGVLLIAFILYMRYGDKKMDRRHLLLMYLLLALIGSCKVVYFAMALLIVLIPNDRFASRRNAVFHKIAGIAFTLVLALGWLSIAMQYLSINPGGGNATEKIIYALTHPLWYIKVMAVTFAYRFPGWVYQAVAPYLGYYDIEISMIFWFLMMGGTVYACLRYVKRDMLGRKRDHRACGVMLFTVFAVLMLFYASIYVQWNVGSPADMHTIEGIQGRYFAPMIMAIITGIFGLPKESYASGASDSGALFGFLSVCNIMVLLNAMISCTYIP